MSLATFLLVLLSSFLHASWNYLAKRISGGIPFVWLIAVVMSLLLLPFSVWWLVEYGFDFSVVNLGALLLASILHLVYFVALQKGYEAADLSVVYPLSRGSGPVFTALGAVLFLGETLSISGIIGLCMVFAGVLLISGLGQKSADSQRQRLGVMYGFGIGLLISCYTVWDSYSVKVLLIAPLLLEYTAHPLRVLVLLPVARKHWPEIQSIWRQHHWKIIAISLMSPIAFILILYAIMKAPVHIIAPAREMSIVFGIIFGAKLLTEENFLPRFIGSLLILAGIILLAV